MPNKSTVDVTAAKLYNDIKADLAFNREMKPMWFSNLAHPNSLDCLHYRLAVYCDLPGWRRARGLVGARCDVTQRSALALSKLATWAPDAKVLLDRASAGNHPQPTPPAPRNWGQFDSGASPTRALPEMFRSTLKREPLRARVGYARAGCSSQEDKCVTYWQSNWSWCMVKIKKNRADIDLKLVRSFKKHYSLGRPVHSGFHFVKHWQSAGLAH